MIKNTFETTPDHVLSAYKDNAAVMEGSEVGRYFADHETGRYDFHQEPAHILMKVETHNHPTAISPWPGAATGSGGEIRDEGATGRGAKPKAGLVGFSVSNLRIPGFEQPWEEDFGKPERIVTALDIMTEGPLGGAAFNNEFGRPALNGYFRTYEEKSEQPQRRRAARLSQTDHAGGRDRQHSRRSRTKRRDQRRCEAGRSRRPGNEHRSWRRSGVFHGVRSV